MFNKVGKRMCPPNVFGAIARPGARAGWPGAWAYLGHGCAMNVGKIHVTTSSGHVDVCDFSGIAIWQEPDKKSPQLQCVRRSPILRPSGCYVGRNNNLRNTLQTPALIT